MIVLSSDVAVKDLLDKKSAIYSDRPDMFIGQKIASGNLRLVVMVRPAIFSRGLYLLLLCFAQPAGLFSSPFPSISDW
jgi:hypothetical protein